jgi:hypothetical protein
MPLAMPTRLMITCSAVNVDVDIPSIIGLSWGSARALVQGELAETGGIAGCAPDDFRQSKTMS